MTRVIHALTVAALAFWAAVLLVFATAELERDSYPPPYDAAAVTEPAPDGTLPGTDCPDGRTWTDWCGCEAPLDPYGDC